MPSPNHLAFTNRFIHIAWPIKKEENEKYKIYEKKKKKKLAQNYRPGY